MVESHLYLTVENYLISLQGMKSDLLIAEAVTEDLRLVHGNPNVYDDLVLTKDNLRGLNLEC